MRKVDTDPDDPLRQYIPLPGGWELQTKGKGSTTRLLDRKTGNRHAIQLCDGPMEREFVTCMALEAHEAVARMREALEPFHRHYRLNDLDKRHPDDALEIPVADLRRAHDLYEALLSFGEQES